MRIYLAVIIIVILIILYFAISSRNKPYEDYLYGFWLAEDSFCENSDIDSMMLFVGEAEKSTLFSACERNCYLIIMNDMCNQGMTLTYKSGWAPLSIGKYILSANVKFDDEQIWTEQVKICIDVISGTMKIYTNDIIYAKLLKQHDITNTSKIF